jgi:hypothetical protein
LHLKKVGNVWSTALCPKRPNALENLALPSCGILRIKGCSKIQLAVRVNHIWLPARFTFS